MNFNKLDWLCVIFMIAVVMVAASFWALSASMIWMESEFIWVGWVWWCVLAICVAVLLVFVMSMESIWSRIKRR